MKKNSLTYFSQKLFNQKEHYPYSGQIELTYRCNLSCVHCYCQGAENKQKELSTKDWEKILDEIYQEGCLSLCLTGGEPLIRDDFLEIYAYAKKKGFIITIFTNGQLLTKKIIDYFVKSPPFAIEITLNGITEKTYESITQMKGSFSRIMKIIKNLAKTDLRVILKSNCLKQNKGEIGKIKAFTEEAFGKIPQHKYRFKYGPLILPRLNRNKTPCNYRLSVEELSEVMKQDADILKEYQRSQHSDFPKLNRNKEFLYHCTAWHKQFFINPYGQLKFCTFSDKFSIDLKTASFKYGFYKVFPQVLNARFKTNSKCKNCALRPACCQCPARAFLETGDEEAPVDFFCQLAKMTTKKMAGKHSI
ncbi:MAG: radical SAM protein [Candidatus Omnitrophica bacterium]|nr:radical SAM protein [Candidatus Omnitrophota bacterium]